MVNKTEAQLQSWTKPASDAEQKRYDWTRDQIRDALRGGNLDKYSFDVYPKGSYPNNTNVVRDSDVDVAVELTELQRHEFIHSAKGMTLEDFGISRYSGSYSLTQFKDDVETALERQFGPAAVDRGNKAIHVRESARSLKADVVVCQTLKSHPNPLVSSTRTGILIRSDTGQEIHNFPKHHLDEGVRKNEATSRRFKRLVRIVKRLENEMVDKGLIDAVPSFLMESMVWNVSDYIFNNNDTYTVRLREALRHMFHADKEKWMEVNNIKFLFHPSQKWTEEQAVDFVRSAWNYMGYA
jgi:hypothetical protein